VNSKLQKLLAVIINVGMILYVSCKSTDNRISSEYCGTKYPIVLVHGVAFRDTTILLKYWGDIPDILKRNGAFVRTSGQSAYGSIVDNAAELKLQIMAVINATGAEKVNIIAHSRGGIESRYMITKLDMGSRVASLTTISTPHRGSSMADIIMKHVKDDNVLTTAIDFYAKIIGDGSPESYNAGKELTRDYMKTFNEQTPDVAGVYYQSYAGAIDDTILHPVWRAMYKSVKKREGENDGLVSIDSAKWGVFKGVMTSDGKAKVSHADEVGMHAASGLFSFDAPAFYREAVHELVLMGF
jgi:triacylglycerol lipase